MTNGPPITNQANDKCPNCGLLAWAQSSQLDAHDAARFNNLITHHRPIEKNTYLHHAGSPLESLHVVHSGFLKSIIGNEDGKEQITGFLMPGDPVELDAIASKRHQSGVIAVEDSSVCGISLVQLEQLCCEFPAFQHHFHQLLSGEINHDHRHMLWLGVMHAEERIVRFLLSFSERIAARGYSATQFKLPKHQDIASYLGLSLETVSRELTSLRKDEIIALDHYYIQIKNVDALKQRSSSFEKRRSPPHTHDILPP